MSCDQNDERSILNEPIAARAYDQNLPLSEIENHIPLGTSSADSITMASRYMDQWIREQVMVHQAELWLP